MDLKKIISQGESERLEFKKSLKLKDKVGESISAFSNSIGGIILIGISDKKETKESNRIYKPEEQNYKQ